MSAPMAAFTHSVSEFACRSESGWIYPLTSEGCERPEEAKRDVCELRIGKLVRRIGGSVVVPVAVECRVRDHHRRVRERTGTSKQSAEGSRSGRETRQQ